MASGIPARQPMQAPQEAGLEFADLDQFQQAVEAAENDPSRIARMLDWVSEHKREAMAWGVGGAACFSLMVAKAEGASAATDAKGVRSGSVVNVPARLMMLTCVAPDGHGGCNDPPGTIPQAPGNGGGTAAPAPPSGGKGGGSTKGTKPPATLAPDKPITVNKDNDTLTNKAVQHGNGSVTVTPAGAVKNPGECVADPFPDITGLTEADYKALVAELPTLSTLTWSPQDLCNIQGGGLRAPYDAQLSEARAARDAAIQAAADKAAADKATADKAAADKAAADNAAAEAAAAANDPCAGMDVSGSSTAVSVSAQQVAGSDLNPQAQNAVADDARAKIALGATAASDKQSDISSKSVAAAAALRGSNGDKPGQNNNGLVTAGGALLAAEAARRGARHLSTGKAHPDPKLLKA